MLFLLYTYTDSPWIPPSILYRGHRGSFPGVNPRFILDGVMPLNPVCVFVACLWRMSSSICHFTLYNGARRSQLVEALRYKPEVAGSIPDGVIGIVR